MAQTSFTSLIYSLRAELPQCLDNTILEAIVDSAREFFRKSRVWMYTSDEITFSPTLAEYDIEPPSGSDIIELVHLKQDGFNITAKSMDWLNANVPNWMTITSSRGQYYTMVGRRTFRVTPVPSSISTNIDLRMSLTLPKGATSLDEDVYDEFEETIAAGALYRLMGQTNVPWSNPRQSKYNEDIFYRDISEARIRALKDNTPAASSVKMRPIA